MRLLPLWRILNREYETNGWPFKRHAILVERADSAAFELVRDAPDQHFIGDDLLVAPVVDEDVESRSVVFPPGRWYGFPAGEMVEVGDEGLEIAEVAAPLSEIPVYARGGSILPLLDESVQTSYRSEADWVTDDGDLDGIRDLVVFHDLSASVELVDGRAFTWAAEDRGPLFPGEVTLDGVVLPPCSGNRAQDCVRPREEGRWVLEVSWSSDESVLVGPGWTLTATGAEGTRGTVELRYPED